MTYTDYFGLSETPFSVLPDPRFLYQHGSFKEAMATLRYGIGAHKGFVLITGEEGAGKTTLLRALMNSLASDVRTAFIFDIPASFTELLQTILRDLGLLDIAEDRSLLTGRLNQFLIEQLKERRTVSLLIDEAQQLSNEMLEGIRLLSNLETDKEKLLQIVLVGQPELEIKLDQPQLWQLKQRLVMRCRLARLAGAEVGPYIDSRLRMAGYAGSGPFQPEALEAIAGYARGIPRLINVICDSALAMASEASRREISAGMIAEVARGLQLRNEPQSTSEAPQSAADAKEREKDRAESSEPENTEIADAITRIDAMESAARANVTKKRVPFVPTSPAMGVGTLLGVMLLAAVCLLFYSRDIGNSLWKLPAKLTDEPGVRTSWQQVNKVSAPDVRRKNPDAGPHLQEARNRDAAPPTEAVNARATPAPEVKSNRKSKTDVRPSAEQKSTKTVPAEDPLPDRLEPQAVSVEAKQAQESAKASSSERQPSREVFYEVVDLSFVRDKPQSNANIIASLPRGTWVKLLAERGEYLQVLSLNDKDISGYVHREDAFFEPLRIAPELTRRSALPPGDQR
ncbi:MAG TPA: AAA family ATPase [Candidatus Binatia bacterium]|nr:AAA family ATPase [Candidatus Binatia bacterium]